MRSEQRALKQQGRDARSANVQKREALVQLLAQGRLAWQHQAPRLAGNLENAMPAPGCGYVIQRDDAWSLESSLKRALIQVTPSSIPPKG